MARRRSFAWLGRAHPSKLLNRWKRRRERLDPYQIPRPVAPPGPRDFVIAGCQRTGTSLAAAALFQPPGIVTLVEPWDGLRLPPDALFRRWRQEIASGEIRGGTLDFDALRNDGRVIRVPEGSSRTKVAADPDVLLGIKWPTFFQYLDLLPDTKFVLCIRHPFEVIGSMQRLSGSNVQSGLDYDLPFNRVMNAELRRRHADPALRRIALFDYVHERVLHHLDRPNVFVVRYEHWLERRDALLGELGAFLGVSLGACPVKVRSRAEQEDCAPDTRALIRAHSTTAARLGYDLSD